MDRVPGPTFTCATCQSVFDWAPVVLDGLEYCCGGCASGGPCSCSYDAEAPTDGELPIDATEWKRLCDEVDRLEQQVAQAVTRRWREFGTPADEGHEMIPVWEIEARQHQVARLHDVLLHAHVEPSNGHPLIGARLTLRDSDGNRESFVLVAPGEEDPTLNRVRADSPFGRLLLRAHLGSTFTMKVPDGARRVTLESITYEPAAVAR